MQDFGYPGLSPYAASLEQLQRMRTLLRWIRMALWVWGAATLVWALPFGPWSAAQQGQWLAATTGCMLSSSGAALALLQRRASRTQAIRAAIAA